MKATAIEADAVRATSLRAGEPCVGAGETAAVEEPGPTAPIIARLGGLPIEAIECFSTDLDSALAKLWQLEAEIDECRDRMVEKLYKAIHGAPVETRRSLLAIKRDCFNGRPILHHRGTARWDLIAASAGSSADRLADLEAAHARGWSRFVESFDRSFKQQCDSLVELLSGPVLRHGLALASPVFSAQVRQLRRRPVERYRRREKRMALTLLRYASRAAVKLSPFSTFTPIALGKAASLPPGVDMRLVGCDWELRSLVRIKRYLLDQYVEMLRRYQPLRQRLRVEVNDSLSEISEGRCLYLRPSHWELDEANSKLAYHEAALVKIQLGGFIERVTAILAQDRLTYRRLISVLAEELGRSRTEVGREIDRMLEIGLLQLELPWACDEGYLEKRILEQLKVLPREAALDAFLLELDRLVELEESFPLAADPGRCADEIRKSVTRLWRRAAPLGGVDPEVRYGQVSDNNIYQDTAYVPPATPESGPILEVEQEALARAFDSVEPLVRLTRVFDHRLEGLLTLGAWAAEQWPGRRRIPLLEAFDAFRSQWREFVEFQLAVRHPQRWRETWNPLDLEALAELAGCRQSVWTGLEKCLRPTEEGQRISRRRLSALLDRLPARFASSATGACLFLQPAAGRGFSWVLNRLKEGTGRFSSRFTAILDAEARRGYLEHLARRGAYDVDGERYELLDLQAVQGDTLNVHAPYTPKLLTLPGASTVLSEDHVRTLGELELSVGDGGIPQIRDRDGQPYLAVFLGGGHYDYMPTLIKFLCLFGPSETGAVFPSQRQRQEGEVTIFERTLIGEVVVHRKRWSLSTAPLRAVTDGLDDAGFFAAIERRRLDYGIPQQVFLIERVAHPHHGARYQPQYLDLSSPMFMSLLRSALEEPQSAALTLVEALPSPATFPEDGGGSRRAVEVIVDALAFDPPSTKFPATPPESRGKTELRLCRRSLDQRIRP